MQNLKTKTKRKASKHKHRQIPPDVLDQLGRELAKLEREFAGLKLPYVSKVRIKKSAPLYSRMADSKEALTLNSDSEHPVIDMNNKHFRVLYDDSLYYLDRKNVESMTTGFSSALTGDALDWVHAKWAKLISRAEQIRDKFGDLPSVKISGFSIGLPASFAIEFEFKND